MDFFIFFIFYIIFEFKCFQQLGKFQAVIQKKIIDVVYYYLKSLSLRENINNLIDLEDVVEFKYWIKWAKTIFWLLNNEVFISA